MKALMVVAIAVGVSLPALGQTNDKGALIDCVQAADQKYKDTWEAVCAKLAKDPLFQPQHPGCCKGYCTEFVGSPRDKEFSQLRIDELSVCARLYGAAK
jgi:hypothetical protein